MSASRDNPRAFLADACTAACDCEAADGAQLLVDVTVPMVRAHLIDPEAAAAALGQYSAYRWGGDALELAVRFCAVLEGRPEMPTAMAAIFGIDLPQGDAAPTDTGESC